MRSIFPVQGWTTGWTAAHLISRITYAARDISFGDGFITGVDGDKIFRMLDGTAVGIVEFHGTGIAQVVGGKGCADWGQYADHSQGQGKFLHHRIHPFFYFFFSWFFFHCYLGIICPYVVTEFCIYLLNICWKTHIFRKINHCYLVSCGHLYLFIQHKRPCISKDTRPFCFRCGVSPQCPNFRCG